MQPESQKTRISVAKCWEPHFKAALLMQRQTLLLGKSLFHLNFHSYILLQNAFRLLHDCNYAQVRFGPFYCSGKFSFWFTIQIYFCGPVKSGLTKCDRVLLNALSISNEKCLHVCLPECFGCQVLDKTEAVFGFPWNSAPFLPGSAPG